MTKRRKARGRKKSSPRTRKPAQNSTPLPPPVEVAAVVESAPPQEQSGGLFAGLGNLLGGTVEAEPEPEAAATSSTPSQGASAGSSPDGEMLSAEAEQILAGIPDVIGGEADDPGGPADVSAQVEAGGLIPSPAGPVDEKTGRALLVQFGAMLAQWRDFEDYKAWGASAGETCGQHLANVANTLWARYAPSFLQSVESTCPGAMALAFGAGLPLVAVVMRDMARAKAVPLVQPTQTPKPHTAAAPGPAARPARGIVFAEA